MISTPRLMVFSILLLSAFRLIAATNPEPPTAKERAQGYREHVLLAKPRAQHRATVDAAEAGERVHVRERFARFGDLRVIELDAGETVENAIARLQATGRYEFVEPDHLMFYDATPNDPLFASQWSLNNTGQLTGSTVGADVRALTGWDILHDAPNVIVAMIDGGARLDHEDIAPNLWRNPSPTFGDVNGASIIRGARTGNVSDEDGHGSHTAGIVGAAGNNGVAISGIAWRVQLMLLKNSGADGSSSASDSAACVDYAIAHGAQVINCSFGGSGFSQAFFTALKAARDAGVIVVCSAGNDGLNEDTTTHYPSNYLLDNLVSVGNSGPTDLASTSSNFGAAVDLFAPGTSIISCDFASTTGVVSKSGTSMAAPHVTGTLALLRAQFPNDNYRQLINRLLRGTDLKTNLAGRTQTTGRLNVRNALATTTNRPANDDFPNAYIITGTSLALRANNRGATVQPGEPALAEVPASGTLWWTWVAPSSGSIVVDTAGSEIDTTLAIYSGAISTPVSGLTPVGANDDNGGNTTSRVNFTAAAGTSYYISIGGKAGGEGYVQLNLSLAPANDNFASATTLSGDSTQATQRNNSATLETGEPKILGFTGGASLWYKWTAPRNARYQVSAFTFDFDALLAVYTGSALDNLQLIASDDDTDSGPGITNGDSRCTIDAVAGTTYYFQVDTKTGTARGEVVVSITDSLWQFSTDGGDITASPAIAADGTIYIGAITPDRRLYAVNPDGTLKWTYTAGGSIDIGSAAIAADGTIYQGSLDGKVVALTPAGVVRWTRDLGGTAAGAAVTPAIGADGTIYIHANDGFLSALNPTDGSVKWRYDVAAKNTFASAVVAPDGTIYQGSDDQGLYALTPAGALKWRFASGSDSFSTPALDATGNIYYATYTTPKVICVAPDGTQRWAYTGMTSPSSSSPVLSADGTSVYIGSADRRLHAIDAVTGAAKWTFTTGNSILGCTPAVDSNGVIYVGSYDGKLYAVTPGGSLKRTWDTAEPIRSSPAIFGTTLYVGGRDAKLYAFNIGASAAGGPWPQYRQNVRHTGRVTAEALAITAAPLAQNTNAGNTVTFWAAATGQAPLTYQWLKDGVAIAGATLSSYTIANASLANAGSYAVTITGPQGSVTSAPAVLAFSAISNAGRLSNVSILTSIATPGDNFTLGYVIGGTGTSGTKRLLIRAAGPALGALGVTGTLDDPKLELFAGASKISENDNWGGSSNLSAAMAAVGAFPYGLSTSKDAAALADLSLGDNSVKVSASGNGTGTVLAEIYDATPNDNFTRTTPRLVNLSVLKQLGGGFTVGFTILGSNSTNVLIRAIGPTLGAAPFNIRGVVADPQITLRKEQTIVATNDNWSGTAALTTAFSSVAAFALSATSRDAALVAALAPGGYTVQVSGVGGATGMVLVEVYEVP